MKRVLLATAAILTLVTAAPVSAAPGWYFGAAGGLNWLDDTSPDTISGGSIVTSFDTGWAVAGTMGYSWPSGIRGELEAAYRYNNIGDIQVKNGGDGDMVQFSLMANALYDVPVDDNFRFTFGGGLGLGEGNLGASGFGAIIRKGRDNFKFAWQLIGGAAYHVWGSTDLFAEYHYFANRDHDVVTFPTSNPLRDDIDADNNTVFVGLRFGMGD